MNGLTDYHLCGVGNIFFHWNFSVVKMNVSAMRLLTLSQVNIRITGAKKS